MLRLIEATGGDVVGANLDPSHLMWMGAHIPTVIRTLGEVIFHVHAKDIRINDWVATRDVCWTPCPSPNPVRAPGIT
jgi:sugar phosphate isomerase/epimerase